MISNRQLSKVLENLGGDPSSTQPDLLGLVSPVYAIGDLRFAASERTAARFLVSPITSAAIAEFSAIEFTPRVGCWCLSCFISSGGTVQFDAGHPFNSSTMVTNDVTPFACYVPPEDGNSQAVATARWANFQVGTLGLGGLPLFTNVAVGRRGGSAPIFGVFVPAASPCFREPYWIPPNTQVIIAATTSNTVIAAQLELAFPVADLQT